ncbi:Fe-S-containing protein [Candidatus Altiarchaeota archaeon]
MAGRKQKKERFTKADSNDGIKKMLIPVAGVILLVMVGYSLMPAQGPQKAETIDLQPESQNTGGATAKADDSLRLPVSTINDGIAHYYEYPSKTGKTIRFFIVKSKDGVIRAAFDACDVCYREKKGYRQEGDEMVCNNCGMRFPTDKINVVKGGCNPAPLTRVMEGDYLVVKKDDLETGAKYF